MGDRNGEGVGMLTEKERVEIKLQLIEHEGFKLKPYRCPAGKLTIGAGRNLEDKGLSREEALYLLDNDIDEALAHLSKKVYWDTLGSVRKRVLIDMVHNLGGAGFDAFKQLNAALILHDYERAAVEMRDSRWYHQVGPRAERLAKMMEQGV